MVHARGANIGSCTTEQHAFGDVSRSSKILAALRKHEQPETAYVPLPLALRAVRSAYEGNPVRPKPTFARDLLEDLRDLLDLPPHHTDKIRLYSAVGTSLDSFHGIDAWVEFPGEEGESPYVVTVDIVHDDETLCAGHKADVIIEEVPPSDETSYAGFVCRVAQEVFRALAQKIRERSAALDGRRYIL